MSNIIGLDPDLKINSHPVASDDAYEAPPDPTGDQPVDGAGIPIRLRWNRKRWKAYQLFCAGRTTPQVAEELAISEASLIAWRRKWRERFGPEFDFKSSDIPGVRDAGAIERAISGPPTTVNAIAERAAEDLSRIGEKGRQVLIDWLNSIANDEFRVERLTHQEVKVINQIATDAEIRAAQLRDESKEKPRGGTRIFAGLEMDTANPDDVGGAVVSLRAAFDAFNKDFGPKEDVIEIGGST